MKKPTASSILVAAMMLAVAVLAQAQQATAIPRIGILAATSASIFLARLEGISPTAARAWLCRREKHCH